MRGAFQTASRFETLQRKVTFSSALLSRSEWHRSKPKARRDRRAASFAEQGTECGHSRHSHTLESSWLAGWLPMSKLEGIAVLWREMRKNVFFRVARSPPVPGQTEEHEIRVPEAKFSAFSGGGVPYEHWPLVGGEQ